jgi:hypothetical protein
MRNDDAPALTPTVVADTSFIYAMGSPDDEKYEHVSTYAINTGTTFYVPPRVYEECRIPRATDYGVVPQVQRGQSDDWIELCETLDYQAYFRDGMNVVTVMDRVRAKMAHLRGGDEDHVEKTDTALAGYAVQFLVEGDEQVTIAMLDRTAEAAIMAVFTDTPYSNRVHVSSPREIFEACNDDVSTV